MNPVVVDPRAQPFPIGIALPNGWRTRRIIGFGRTSVVYEAQRGAEVAAIKALFRSATDTMRQRFERERTVIDKVNHLNVVQVFEHGEFDHLPYIVMEMLDGSLLEMLEAPLQRDEVIRIGAGVLHGLQAIHDAGIIHRDLKPEHVMFSDYVPKLVDFGVGHRRGNRSLTGRGVLVGTPRTMAPEQIVAETRVDQRADLYAAAVMLYWLLAGRPPHNQRGVAKILSAILKEPAPRLGELTDSTSELDAFFERALQKRPEDRFQTAQDMRRALALATRGSRSALSEPPAAP